jgi:hypothetical protein
MLQFGSLLMSFKDAIVYLSPFSSNHYMLSGERDIISGNRIRLSLFSALLLPPGGCAASLSYCAIHERILSVVVERAAVFFLLSYSLSMARVDRSLAQIAVPVLAHVCNGSRLTCCVNIILRVNIVAIQTTCVLSYSLPVVKLLLSESCNFFMGESGNESIQISQSYSLTIVWIIELFL